MKDFNEDLRSARHTLPVLQVYFLSFTVALIVMWPSFASTQVPQEHAASMEKEHEHPMQSYPTSLSDQIRNLSHQVSELEARVREQGVDTAAMKANGDERRMKMAMGNLGGVPQAPLPQSMNPAASSQMPAANMMAGMMSMMNSMMGGMTGMPANAPMGQAAGMGPSGFLSVLPGFPGASHLYHIGSTNFFLDHPQHISLSLEQQSRLADIRTKALMRRADFNRKIQEVEEQLWLLTASDQPNFSSIEAKVRESEKLHGDWRLAFIKDVGEAAKILTEEQRNALLGQFSSPAKVAPITPPSSQVMEGM